MANQETKLTSNIEKCRQQLMAAHENMNVSEVLLEFDDNDPLVLGAGSGAGQHDCNVIIDGYDLNKNLTKRMDKLK